MRDIVPTQLKLSRQQIFPFSPPKRVFFCLDDFAKNANYFRAQHKRGTWKIYDLFSITFICVCDVNSTKIEGFSAVSGSKRFYVIIKISQRKRKLLPLVAAIV